jgi:hypothetical protein
MVLKEVIEKENAVVRYESLTIPLSGEDGHEATLTFESEDPETMMINADGKFVGLCDMDNFLSLCRRALELWENERQEKEAQT